MESGNSQHCLETKKMVLVGRKERLAEFREDRALGALVTVLFDSEGSLDSPNRVSQTDDAVVAALFAVREENEDSFRKATAMLDRRKISADCDWVHDDLLAFAVVVGNLRFGGCDRLVKQLLDARLTGADEQNQKMTQSLSALADSRADAPLIMVLYMGKFLVDPDRDLDGELLSRAYAQAAKLEIHESTKPILRLLGEKVADIATRVGAQGNASDYSRLSTFRNSFDRRARFASHAVLWLLLLGSALLWIYFARLFFSGAKDSEEFAGKLFDMGVILGPIAILLARNKIRKWVRRLFYRAFGGGILLNKDVE